MKTLIEKIGFSDMSDGLKPSDSLMGAMIAEVEGKLLRGEPHWSISTGNFAVVGIAYASEIQIFVTNNYARKTIYK